ncbi:hypothetical protein [Streptomyces sp. MN13]
MHARTAAIAAIAALTLSACGTEKDTATDAKPTATTASPSKDLAEQLREWNRDGGGETLQTLVDDLAAVDEASDPVDLAGLREACATLTADLEIAQQGDPIPHRDSDDSWALALEHLTNSATACTTGAVSEDQASFDLMASEMDIGIQHLNKVNEHLDKVLAG